MSVHISLPYDTLSYLIFFGFALLEVGLLYERVLEKSMWGKKVRHSIRVVCWYFCLEDLSFGW
jgi:hypothetical protein